VAPDRATAPGVGMTAVGVMGRIGQEVQALPPTSRLAFALHLRRQTYANDSCKGTPDPFNTEASASLWNSVSLFRSAKRLVDLDQFAAVQAEL
jgi:hypothetical protein